MKQYKENDYSRGNHFGISFLRVQVRSTPVWCTMSHRAPYTLDSVMRRSQFDWKQRTSRLAGPSLNLAARNLPNKQAKLVTTTLEYPFL
jgi:hypothetical protein